MAQVLYPALQPLLDDGSWPWWEGTLARMSYSPEAMDAFLASHQVFQSHVDARRAERAAERAAYAAGAAADGGGQGGAGRRSAKGGRSGGAAEDPEREQRRAAGRLRKQEAEASAAQAAEP